MVLQLEEVERKKWKEAEDYRDEGDNKTRFLFLHKVPVGLSDILSLNGLNKLWNVKEITYAFHTHIYSLNYRGLHPVYS
jgi:hypothetical protein